MTTTDFWQTLDSLSLDDNTMEHEESKRIIEEISKDLEELIPNKLFRYRSFDSNDYNIRAIERDEIWASSLSIMNDYLEYDPYWDLDLVLTMIEDSVEAIKSLDVDSFVRKYQQGVKDTFGPDIDLSLLMNDDIRNAIVRINKLLLKDAPLLIKELKENPDILRNQIKSYLDTTFVSCFTDDGYSNIMAGLYADSAKGFILEYDSKSLVSPCNKKDKCKYAWTCTTLHHSPILIPVNYQDYRYDISTMLSASLYKFIAEEKAKTVDPSVSFKSFQLDRLFPLKLAGRKQIVWQHEKEWRLIYFCNENSPIKDKHVPIKIIPPSAIILCPNYSKENKERIRGIAKKKSIPLYELKIDYQRKEYNALRKVLIN